MVIRISQPLASFEIATGSSFELETLLFIIEELVFCSKEEISDLKDKLTIEQKMINKLISTIKTNNYNI